MSQFFTSRGQRIGISASTSVLPVNIQDSFPLGWSDFMALKSLLRHHSLKASILWHSAFFMVQLSQPYVTTGKTAAWTRRTFLAKWCPCFLISCLGLSHVSFQGARHLLSAVILEPKKINSITASPSVGHAVIKCRLLSQSCFRFTAKMRGRPRQCPFTPYPCSCPSPTTMNTSHLHPQSGECVYTYIFN